MVVNELIKNNYLKNQRALLFKIAFYGSVIKLLKNEKKKKNCGRYLADAVDY